MTNNGENNSILIIAVKLANIPLCGSDIRIIKVSSDLASFENPRRVPKAVHSNGAGISQNFICT